VRQSVRTQHKIGSDIVMVLDDVVHSCTDDPERFVEATARTVRWLDRCIAAHKTPEDPVNCGPQHQNLFGIVQGGLDVSEVRVFDSPSISVFMSACVYVLVLMCVCICVCVCGDSRQCVLRSAQSETNQVTSPARLL
jgi:hypothetical protein